MGKGLSSLQRDILVALALFPAFEDGRCVWAMPGEILDTLDRRATPANQVALSKALKRLHERGLVARASGEFADVGKAFRYSRIPNPLNAGAGNAGPKVKLGNPRRGCAMKDVSPRRS